MVAEYDDRPVPKIIDFGVAKAVEQRLTEKTVFTQLGQVVGTIEYMSPEQAKLNQLDIDTRSDIYSLGVLLYELLVGETPFDRTRLRSAAFDELLRIIREEEPPKPSVRLSSSHSLPSIAANRHIEPKKLSTLVRGELDWIVMKAMEKDRTRRYETANGLAADIQRYLDDERVEACPPSTAYRFRKFARRNKAAIFTTGVLLSVLLLGIAGTTLQAFVATRERNRAVEAERLVGEQRDRAVQAENVAKDEAQRANQATEREMLAAQDERAARLDSQHHLYDARMSLVRSADEQGQRARVLELLDQCRPDGSLGDDEFRSFEWYYWWRQCHRYSWSFSRDEERTTRDRDRVAVSPDGSLAVIAREVWELTTGKRLGTLFYPGEEEWLAEYAALEEAVQRNPDDEEIADTRNSMLSKSSRWHTDAILFSPDGKMVAAKKHAWENDAHVSTLHLFDVATCQPIQTMLLGKGTDGFVRNYAMAFSPDGSLITAVPYLIRHSEPQEIRVWEVGTGNVGPSFRPSGDRVPTSDREKPLNYTRALAFSPDGTLLATTGHDENGASRTRLWDMTTGECVQTLWAREGHAVTMQLRFSEDGKRLLGQSYDDEITVWDLATGEIDSSAPTPLGGRISPDGRTAMISGDYGAMELRDVASGEKTATLLGHSSGHFLSEFSHDGNWLVSVDDEDEQVRVWDLRTDRLSRDHIAITDVGARWGYSLFDFSPDGKTLACCHDRGTVDLWDVATERRVRMLAFDFVGPVYAVAFSPDGRTLAAAGRDRETGKFRIDLHDLQTGVARRLGEHAADIRSLKFSPNGKFLASGDADDGVRVWELASGEATLVDLNGNPEREPWDREPEGLSTPSGYTQSDGCVVWSPDSRMVVYTGRAPGKGSWQVIADPQTGEVLRRLDYEGGGIVAFSPDGSFLAVASGMEIQLVACNTWEIEKTLTGHMRTINGVAFSPDGRRIASATKDQTILWNVATGAPVLTLPAPRTRRYSSMAFSPDGTRLAIGGSSGRDSSVHIYRTATKDEVAVGRSYRDVVPEMDLAKACEDRGEWRQAIEHYSREIAVSPNDDAPWRGRANCHLEAGQLDETFEDLQHIVDLWSDFGVALGDALDQGNRLLQLGNRWASLGESEKAMKAYRLRLRTYEIACSDIPREPEVPKADDELNALGNLARAHTGVAKHVAQAGDSQGAIEHLKEAVDLYLIADVGWLRIKKNHVPGDILGLLFGHLSETGRWEEAIGVFREVIEKEPENSLGYRYLGDALRFTGKHQAAVEAYRKAIAWHEDGGGPHNNLALVLKAMGDVDGAIDALESAIAYAEKKLKAEPKNTMARKLFGIAKKNLVGTCTTRSWQLATAADPAVRDPEKAVELSKRALELDPDNGNHWSNLGVAEYRAGDFSAAVEAFEKGDSMRKDGDMVHRMFFAMACWQNGDKQRACALYEQAVVWINEHRSDNEAQQRFRAEAEALMGITGEEPEVEEQETES